LLIMSIKSMAKISICLFFFLTFGMFLVNIVFISVDVVAQPDNAKPTFSNGATNTTLAGKPTNFTINVADNYILNVSAAYIFSTNNTGKWKNSSAVAFTDSGNSLYAWNLSTLNTTVGAVVSWQFYANDTSGNWNASDIYNLTTTTTEAINISVFNSTGDPTGTGIKIYNSSDELVGSGTAEMVTELYQYQNYTLELNEDVDGDFLTIKVVDLNITGSFNIQSQTAPSYTETLPSGYNKISSVIAFNDTGLTYSYTTIYIPNESFTFTDVFHCNDAWNYTEGDCDDDGWEVADISAYNAKSNASHTFFNVTTFDGYGGGGEVWLEVELILPPGDTFVEQYATFNVNATVFCRGGDCSNVFGTARYNSSSDLPNIGVNTTYGDEPIFVNESSPQVTKACPTNTLSDGEYCNVTWVLNATGMLDGIIIFGVLFNSSDAAITWNHTANVTLTIVPCIEEITVHFSDIGFGTIFPNSVGNPAIQNPDDIFNVTNSGTCTSNVWIKSTNLVDVDATWNVIQYSNISFNNVTDDFASSARIGDSYQADNSTFKKDVPEGTNVTAYFFLDLPPSYSGDYSGNISFCLNSSARRTLC
jgi:hypothetical protein